jgi:hypothetical protein
MQEFIEEFKLDFAKSKLTEQGFRKFSDLLKSLSDERLMQYSDLIYNCLDVKDEKLAEESIAKAVFLYSYFISLFEDPGNLTIKIDNGVEWCQRMQTLIVFEGMRRNGVFSDFEGSLVDDNWKVLPGVKFEEAKEYILSTMPAQFI